MVTRFLELAHMHLLMFDLEFDVIFCDKTRINIHAHAFSQKLWCLTAQPPW